MVIEEIRHQPVAIPEGQEIDTINGNPHLVRNRLPETRNSVTHKFTIGTTEGYITVGIYENGMPGEVFVKMSKQGSTLDGMMDAFSTMLSVSLQSGISLRSLIDKFVHSRFEPDGKTSNPDIPFANSIIDYLFRYLDRTFVRQ